MRNRINSDKQNQCFETCRSYESAEEEKGKSPHFITKVIEVKWNIDGGKLCRLSLQRQLAHPRGDGSQCARNSLTLSLCI